MTEDMLNPRQERFVWAMLSGKSVLEASGIAQVSKNCAYLWMRNPRVLARLHAARQMVFQESAFQVARQVGGALEGIAKMTTEGETDSVRLSAMKFLVERFDQHILLGDLAAEQAALKARVDAFLPPLGTPGPGLEDQLLGREPLWPEA